MTPTDIEKLKERVAKRAAFLGEDTGCGNVSEAELLSLIAALEAAQGENARLTEDWDAAVLVLEAKDAEIERLKALVSSSEAARYATCGELLERVNTLGSLADDLQARIRDLGNERDAAEASLKEAREGGVIIDREHLRNLLKVLRNYPKLASVKAAEALLSKQDSGKESQ